VPGYEFRLSDGKGEFRFTAPDSGKTKDMGGVRTTRAEE
jgi:hypothetical protein